MTNPYANMSHVTNVTLHEGWIEHKAYHEYKWKKSWIVLLGRHLYFYNSQNTSEEKATGVIKIAGVFRFLKRDRGSEKSGYKFELHTNKAVQKFKASKFSERELWRAYLEGVATGQVSDKLDLPPEILVQIRLLLQAQYLNNNNNNNNDTDNESSLTGSNSGDSIDSLPPVPPFDEDGMCYSNDDASDSGCGDDFYQEPANYHLLNYVFFNDAEKRELPSWFFQNCTRDTAEEILIKGNKFGNTLMRKGSANTSNLVISKKMDGRNDNFSHYVINIQAEGYKLKVENHHQPMKCLTDIMDFFIQTSGALTTKPMTCNNLQRIGISPDHIYNPVIIPNPIPREVEITEDSDSPHYLNTADVNDTSSARAWMKNRSQSIPNIIPLNDLQAEVRRQSISTEASRSPAPINSNPRFMIPPLDDIPLPPPPPPPTSSPPKLPSGIDRSNRSRVSGGANAAVTVSTPSPASPPPPPPPPPQSSPSPPLQLPPPPPSSNAPPLPANHPTARRASHGSTLSLASQFEQIAKERTPPPVAPKPDRKSRDEAKKTLGEAFRDRQPMRRREKGNSGEIIYAKIMKKKTPLKQSKSVPLSYENWEASNFKNNMGDTKDRISSLNDKKLIYAEINPEPYVLYQDLKQQKSHEPFNGNVFDEEDIPTSFQHDTNMEYSDDNDDNVTTYSYETYEVSESVFKDRSPTSIRSSVDKLAPKDKVFQQINFYAEESSLKNNSNSNNRKNNNKISSCQIYEPVCDKYKSKSSNTNDALGHPNNLSNSNNGVRNKTVQNMFQGVENEYEIIHSIGNKKTPPVTKPRTIKGISSPGEIYYESVEWKNKVNRPRIPSPKPRRRTNSLTWRTEKYYDDTSITKKSNTLDGLKSGFMFSDDKYYDEVNSNGTSNGEQAKPVSNYVDVIADYEDIKAARISQKQLSTRKLSVPENDFKKKLEMMFGENSSKTLPAIKSQKRPLPERPDLRTAVSPTTTTTNAFPSRPATQDLTDVVYDDLDAYQNIAAINLRK